MGFERFRRGREFEVFAIQLMGCGVLMVPSHLAFPRFDALRVFNQQPFRMKVTAGRRCDDRACVVSYPGFRAVFENRERSWIATCIHIHTLRIANAIIIMYAHVHTRVYLSLCRYSKRRGVSTTRDRSGRTVGEDHRKR